MLAATGDQVGIANRDLEYLLAIDAANIDAPARPVIRAVDFYIVGDELRQLKRLARFGKLATAIVVFRTALTDEIKEIDLHGPPAGLTEVRGHHSGGILT